LNRTSSRIDVLREAAKDLRYLLNRGYHKETVLKIIGDKYLLDKSERLILYRSVYSEYEVEVVSKKKLSAKEVRGKNVWIDGFNVLNTVEAALKNHELALCDDGIVRDFSEVYGKYRISECTSTSIRLIGSSLKELDVSRITVLYESQVSKSGEIAKMMKEILRNLDLDLYVELSKTVDSILSRVDGVVCTSDSAILLKAKHIFDIAGYIIIEKLGYQNLIRI